MLQKWQDLDQKCRTYDEFRIMYKKGNDEYLLDKIFKSSNGARKLKENWVMTLMQLLITVKNLGMKTKTLKPGPKIAEETDLDEVVSAKDKKVIDDFVQMNKFAQNFTQRVLLQIMKEKFREKYMGAQQIASLETDGNKHKIKVHAKMDQVNSIYSKLS